jgi:hypothetical protein
MTLKIMFLTCSQLYVLQAEVQRQLDVGKDID